MTRYIYSPARTRAIVKRWLARTGCSERALCALVGASKSWVRDILGDPDAKREAHEPRASDYLSLAEVLREPFLFGMERLEAEAPLAGDPAASDDGGGRG